MSSRRLRKQSERGEEEMAVEQTGSFLPPISDRSYQQREEGTTRCIRRSITFRDMPMDSTTTRRRRESLMAYEPIIVKFVKNGNRFFEGVKVNVSRRNMKNWEVLLSELSNKIQLPAGVRRIYTPENGHPVTRLSQLEHHGTYVCGSTEPFKKIDYSNLKNPDWKSPSKIRNYDSQAGSVFARTFPMDLSASMHSVKSKFNSSMSSSVSENHLMLKKKPVKLKPLRQPSLSAPDENLELSVIKSPSSPADNVERGLIQPDKLSLTIFRNGPPPRERVTIDLVKDTTSWKNVTQQISEKFLSINGCLRLFALNGTPITSLDELWKAGSMLIAAGAETFDISSFFSGESETVDSSVTRMSNLPREKKTSTPIPEHTEQPSVSSLIKREESATGQHSAAVSKTVAAAEEQTQCDDCVQTDTNEQESKTQLQRKDTPDSSTSRDPSPTSKAGSPTNEQLFAADQTLSDSVSTPPSPHIPFQLHSESPLDPSMRPRTLSLVSEMHRDLLRTYNRPASFSSDEYAVSPLAKSKNFPPTVLPKTPQSDLSELGGQQSMIDMILPKLKMLRTDSEISLGSESLDFPCERKRSIGIQTEFVSDHLSTVIDLNQPQGTHVQVDGETVTGETSHPHRERRPSHYHNDKPAKEKYDVEMAIHEGEYASVKPCTSKEDGQEYLLRAINKAKIFWNDDSVLREVKIMTKLRHENVMRVIDHWETADEMCMVIEPTEGSDLYDCIHHCEVFSEADTVKVMKQLGLALVYLHANRIVHRDIRLENIFLTIHGENDWILKLGGFSLATIATEPLCRQCGKDFFRAPEMKALTGYSAKVDVWAAGMICYLLLSGTMPFTRKSKTNLLVEDKLFPTSYWANVSEEAKDFVRKLLRPSPQQRVSSSEMIQHSWLDDRPRDEENEKSKQLLEHIYAKAADRITGVLILSVTALDHQPKNKESKNNRNKSHYV